MLHIDRLICRLAGLREPHARNPSDNLKVLPLVVLIWTVGYGASALLGALSFFPFLYSLAALTGAILIAIGTCLLANRFLVVLAACYLLSAEMLPFHFASLKIIAALSSISGTTQWSPFASFWLDWALNDVLNAVLFVLTQRFVVLSLRLRKDWIDESRPMESPVHQRVGQLGAILAVPVVGYFSYSALIVRELSLYYGDNLPPQWFHVVKWIVIALLAVLAFVFVSRIGDQRVIYRYAKISREERDGLGSPF